MFTIAIPIGHSSDLAKLRLAKHTKKDVIYFDKLKNAPIISLVDQFDEIPLEKCSNEKSQYYNNYLDERGLLKFEV